MAVTPISGEIQAQPLNDNFSDVENNINTHKAEKATVTDDVHDLITDGKVIQEVGSNANGRYIRFADGTQICTHSAKFVYVSASILGYTWTFPASFVSVDYRLSTFPTYNGITITGVTIATALTLLNKLACVSRMSTNTTTSQIIRYYTDSLTLLSGDQIETEMVVIGRWK